MLNDQQTYKSALHSKAFLFFNVSLIGEGKGEKASFLDPTTNSIKLQKQCSEILEDIDRKPKESFTEKFKSVLFSEGGLYLDGESSQQLRT